MGDNMHFKELKDDGYNVTMTENEEELIFLFEKNNVGFAQKISRFELKELNGDGLLSWEAYMTDQVRTLFKDAGF